METRYVKLDYLDALESKKSMFGSEINLLQIVSKLRSYKNSRLKELDYKNKLRIELEKFANKINLLQESFPGYNFTEDKRKKKEKNFSENNKDLEKELNEIKRKIANLGSK
mgnify:FL=1